MDLEVTNPNLFEKTVASIALDKIGPMTITRLLRRGAAEPTRVSGDTVLKKGDHLRELYTASVISILATLRQFGLPLLAAGILTTLTPLAVAFTACHRLLGIPFLRALGVLTGGMTSTPGLATATTLSPTQYAATAYATVYPVALIGMILFTKLLIWLL